MTASERERVEREARIRELARRFYWNGSLDGGLGRDTDEAEARNEQVKSDLKRMTEFGLALILRERAAAFESAAKACREALNEERRALNAGGYIEACMELESRCRALAAQERAQ